MPAPTDVPSSAFNVVEPGYFATMRIPLLAGRFFTDADTADSAKVVIVNESFAKRWWPNESPLGKRIKQGFPQDDRPFREIVGVVGDVAQEGLDLPIQTEVFLPFAQDVRQSDDVRRTHPVRPDVARAGRHGRDPSRRSEPVGGGSPAAHAVARGVRGAPEVHDAAPRPLRRRSRWRWPPSASTASCPTGSPSARARSGSARPSAPDPARSSASSSTQALRLAGVGLLVGASAAFVLTRFMQSLLFQTPPFDPSTFAGVGVLLTGIVLLACANPARRALRVSPTIALRSE